MSKILLLVDDQLDFVTGSMSVKKRGKECVERTKIFINRNKDEIEKVVFKCQFTSPDDSRFKRNGGEMPMFCVRHTPGACIEPTILKLLWRLQIPYDVTSSWESINDYIPDCGNIVIAGMNGNTSIKKAVKEFWNVYHCELFWPGIWFPEHNESTFKWLRDHTEGIFEVPKRDKKKDLFVQRFKGNK